MTPGTCFLPMTELARRIDRGDVSSVEVVDAYLERINRRNDEIHAYVSVLSERTQTEA